MHNNRIEIDGRSNRYNKNKISFSNIPPEVLIEFNSESIPIVGLKMLAEHFTLAEQKYPHADAQNGHVFPNWAKGQLIESFVIDSMFRHLYAFMHGESFDEDFGSHHLVAVAWGGVVLHHYFTNYEDYKKYDDRKWVGFKHSDLVGLEGNTRIDNVFYALLALQTADDIEYCLAYTSTIIRDSLLVLNDLYYSEKIDFKLDAERMEEIKNTKYGEANTAAEKSNR